LRVEELLIKVGGLLREDGGLRKGYGGMYCMVQVCKLRRMLVERSGWQWRGWNVLYCGLLVDGVMRC